MPRLFSPASFCSRMRTFLRWISPSDGVERPLPQIVVRQPAFQHHRRIGDLREELVLVLVDAALAIGLVLHLALQALDPQEAAARQPLDLDRKRKPRRGSCRFICLASDVERVGRRAVERAVDRRDLVGTSGGARHGPAA